MTNLENKKLITLKEAAQLTGYSSDYIGQLIRSGKIPGKQVYTNITWMTTREAIEDYKKKGQKHEVVSFTDKIQSQKRKIALEFGIVKLFFNTFKSAMPLFVVIVISFALLISYLLYLFVFPREASKLPVQAEQGLRF